MLIRSRILRITLIVLGVLAFAGYFAFSTFLFSPLEGPFGYDVAALIPREADYYVAKARLNRDFDPFPELAAADDLEQITAWKEFSQSADYADLRRDLQLDTILAEVERNLASLPVRVSLLDVFGGKDLALAGYLRENKPLEQADWAIYGHVNWMGKMAVSLLEYPGLLGLDAQGIEATSEDGVVSLSGGQLAQPIHVTRVSDVVVASSDRTLAMAALALAKSGGDGSMLQSARYHDHIRNVASRGPDKDEVELFVDVPRFLAAAGIRGEYPNSRDQNFGTAFSGRLFQVPSFKEVLGVLGLAGGTRMDLHGEILSEKMSAAQNRMYRARGFERSDILNDAAAYAPGDAMLFSFVSLPLEDLLAQALESAEPALRSNLEDALRSTDSLGGIDQVIAELDGMLRDRFAIVVRENDYPPDANGPPHDGAPVFAVGVILWINDAARVERFRDAVGEAGEVFGLRGAQPGELGYYKHRKRGFETREFWSEFVPGTGVVTTLNVNDVVIISNSLEMSAHLAQTHSQVGTRLCDRSDFQALVQSSLHDANAMLWFDPEHGITTMEKRAKRWAEDHVDVSVDWRNLRAQEERKIIPQLFRGTAGGLLSPALLALVDAAVHPTLKAMAEGMRNERVPQLLMEKRRQIGYLKSIGAFLAMVRLSPKTFDLTLRLLLETQG